MNVSAANKTDRQSSDKATPKKEMAKARASVKKLAKANENALIWLPGHRVSYSWDDWSETPGWYEGSTFDYTYYDNGLLKSETDEYQRREYTYDELGRLVKEEYFSYDYNFETGEQTEEMVLGSVYTYEYDSVVKDYVILETGKSTWSDWKPTSYGTEITRNAEGNVTNVRYYRVDQDGEKSYDSEQLVVKYGADGKACEVYFMDDAPWLGEVEYYDHLTDIVWENTDGQILDIEFDDYNSESFFGANRLKSAIAVNEYYAPAQLNVTYDGESFVAKMMIGDVTVYDFEYKVLDAYGSFTCNEYEVEFDSNDDDEYFIEYSKMKLRGETYDSYGLLTEEIDEGVYHYADGEDFKYKEGSKGTVVYDPTYGYPVEYTFAWYDEETDSYANSSRDVFSDYHSYDPTGVETIGNADAETEYFTLQGVKVAIPSKGIYIVRQGDKTFKAAIR